MPQLFKSEALRRVATAERAAYAANAPFPHAVLDGLFSEEALEQVVAEFPGDDAPGWIRYDDAFQRKLESQSEDALGPRTRRVIHELNSAPFLSFLQTLTGIDDLIPDPWLDGGGLHQVSRGGLLSVHADFGRHPRLDLERRVNVLVYLNQGWEDAYGGHLELWDRGMQRCVVRTSPVFNRCVVFNTTPTSYHGLPDAVECPEGIARRSIALYYYTTARPEDERSQAPWTLWRSRPDNEGQGVRSEELRQQALIAIKKLVPPIVVDAAKRVRRILRPS